MKNPQVVIDRKSFFNFYTIAAADDCAHLALEIYERGRLIDVEIYHGWMTRALCDLMATTRNRLAVHNGNHVSIYFLTLEQPCRRAA